MSFGVRPVLYQEVALLVLCSEVLMAKFDEILLGNEEVMQGREHWSSNYGDYFSYVVLSTSYYQRAFVFRNAAFQM